MKKLLLYAFLVLTAGGVSAQSKLSPSALMMIEEARIASRDGADVRVNAIVKLAPGADAASLESADVRVLSQRGRLAIVSMPISKAKGIAALPAVSRMAFGAKAQPLMNEARPASRVTQIQLGTNNGLTNNYSGTNTLLGMMDQGLDPNHINFYNKDLTANRITYVATISGTDATVKEYQTAEEIKGFTTDNTRSSHATHVAGIMGGSYTKPGEVANAVGNIVKISQSISNPYFGVAPEAELNLCVGDLYEENICLGAELFAKRAEASGKPAVFNLSGGSTVGPHDGTDLACQYLAEVGKEVIMCVAAGNDGEEAVSITKTFDASSLSVSTIPAKGDGGYKGLVDVWGADSRPVTVAFALVNSKTGSVSWSADIPETGADKTFLIANSNVRDVSASSSYFDNTFTAASYVIAAATLDKENNRYNVSVNISLTPEGSSVLIPAFIFKGTAGQKINAYAFGTTFTDGGLANYTAGTADQSINNYACADNVLAVGSYTSRVYFPTLAGNDDGKPALYGYGLTPEYIGQVSSFTSYGSLPSGKTLPEFCAPGQVIISSYSKYALEAKANKITEAVMSANAPNTTVNVRTGSRNNYWGYMQGTSMAAPYVAGTVALLLEADPTLKVDKVRELITNTANLPWKRSVGVREQWGAGKLNAEDAMRNLLGMPSAIGDITADTDRRCAVNVLPGSVEAIVAGETGVKASLYSIAGMFAGKAEGAGDSATLTTAGLPRGVYVLNVETTSGVRVSRRILID
ncbi:MAG: S8 family serine peptidase [Paramuribaculum sp.]|nr:S8 family serine peptidase [Paramuribaculum sp.]